MIGIYSLDDLTNWSSRIERAIQDIIDARTSTQETIFQTLLFALHDHVCWIDQQHAGRWESGWDRIKSASRSDIASELLKAAWNLGEGVTEPAGPQSDRVFDMSETPADGDPLGARLGAGPLEDELASAMQDRTVPDSDKVFILACMLTGVVQGIVLAGGHGKNGWDVIDGGEFNMRQDYLDVLARIHDMVDPVARMRREDGDPNPIDEMIPM